ncbi:MAG: NAD(P)-dependent glycerol-3-phosphate dehydrogenase [Clostridia bacterium]|nr:NAD(P)-dependent glycerol-3-phosphate dehydrogenase [Clostridia bacterium]
MRSIGVLGAGNWGTALARMLCNSGHEVIVWSISEEEVQSLSTTRRHPNLAGCVLPEGIRFTGEMAEACRGKDILLCAVPSVYVRSTIRAARPYISSDQIIVDVAKGIEADTLMTMSEVIRDEIRKGGQAGSNPIVALSGPTHAEEVAQDLPTTIVSACEDLSAAETVQDIFFNTCMRVYTNPDIRGVEICGALKNIIALAAGISAGLGYGDNTKAAIITRGLAEIKRLGMAMGCREQTFSGLAGVGDLIVTATSRHSRNNRCGYLIGQGLPAEEAIRQVGMVVEGINALPAAIRLAEKYGIEMPITRTADAVVTGRISASDAVRMLMSRDKKMEESGLFI